MKVDVGLHVMGGLAGIAENSFLSDKGWVTKGAWLAL